MARSKGEVSRRDAIRALLTALPVAAVAGSGVVASRVASNVPAGAPSSRSNESARGVPPRPFDDLPGTKVGRCKVVRVDPVVAGAVPVTLASSNGTEFRVDVLRHDPETPGVARAGSLSVFMNNGGSGDQATVEEHGLGAMALAHVLARREAQGRPVPDLVTLRQRAPLLAAAADG